MRRPIDTFIRVRRGKPYSLPPDGKFRLACCDCGLVHTVKVNARGDEITVALWKAHKATEQRREMLCDPQPESLIPTCQPRSRRTRRSKPKRG